MLVQIKSHEEIEKVGERKRSPNEVWLRGLVPLEEGNEAHAQARTNKRLIFISNSKGNVTITIHRLIQRPDGDLM